MKDEMLAHLACAGNAHHGLLRVHIVLGHNGTQHLAHGEGGSAAKDGNPWERKGSEIAKIKKYIAKFGIKTIPKRGMMRSILT